MRLSTNSDWSFESFGDITRLNISLTEDAEWEFFLMLRSDVHWDNAHCDWELLGKHMDLAAKHNIPILDFGDWFCAMQGKGDRRSSKGALRDIHKKGNYLDSLWQTAAEWMKPEWAKQHVLFADGNHELSVVDHKETDLLGNFTHFLNEKHKLNIIHGSITGFIRTSFRRGGEGPVSRSRTIAYHHGYGGGGPVTKDTIQANRRSVWNEGVDILVSGHTHDAWAVAQPCIYVNKDGNIMRRIMWQVKTPTYKDEYGRGESGWANLKGLPPKSLGCIWVRFSYDWESKDIKTEIIPDIT